MKKILFTLCVVSVIACNNGGGEERCCTGAKDENCDGKCDVCGTSRTQTPQGFDSPCGTAYVDADGFNWRTGEKETVK